MNSRSRWAAVAFGVAVLAGGCESSRPTPIAPGTQLELTGTWSGTVVDSDAGEGTLHWTLTHVDPGLSGTYSTTFADAAFNATGTLAGVVTGTAASVFLTPSAPLSCGPGFPLTGLVYLNLSLAENRITGRYSTFTCAGGRVGTIDLARP